VSEEAISLSHTTGGRTQHSTAQHSTAHQRHDTAQHTAQHSTALQPTTQLEMTRDTAQHSAAIVAASLSLLQLSSAQLTIARSQPSHHYTHKLPAQYPALRRTHTRTAYPQHTHRTPTARLTPSTALHCTPLRSTHSSRSHDPFNSSHSTDY